MKKIYLIVQKIIVILFFIVAIYFLVIAPHFEPQASFPFSTTASIKSTFAPQILSEEKNPLGHGHTQVRSLPIPILKNYKLPIQ